MSRQIILNSSSMLVFLHDSHRYCNCEGLNKSSVHRTDIVLPTHTLLNIYQTFIAPYITYGLRVWGQACKSYFDKLLKLQKRALDFIFFLS